MFARSDCVGVLVTRLVQAGGGFVTALMPIAVCFGLQGQPRHLWSRTLDIGMTLQCFEKLSSNASISDQEQCFNQPEQVLAENHDSMPHEFLYKCSPRL